MFHIFYLNRGYMLRLEPPALGTVYDLQKCIAASTRVEMADQFLFLSGGASLQSGTELSAIPGIGTDTNPIFLVRRVTNVQPEPVRENSEGINELYQGWITGVERLDRISSNSASAIAECVELGKKCLMVAETIVRFCGNVVVEHQYLHQGWLAVIANLDDNLERIQRRLDRSTGQAEKLAMIKERGRQLLANFDTIIDTLNRIIIPTTLLAPTSSISMSTLNMTDSNNSTEEMTLFEWISSKDPAYSLDSYAEHVLDHLEKLDESELNEANAKFEMVKEVAKNSQYRDIGGIEKRLTTLNNRLQQLEDGMANMRQAISRIMQPTIQDTTQNVVLWQKGQLNELKKPLKNLYDITLSMLNSKEEVIKNICQRLSSWVRQAYQRLHESTKRILLFEEKFTGLHQRLDLARQIKETPNVYLSAVPEVLRREELKKEFTNWLTTYTDKCTSFITEENKIRDEFQSKLDRHFLRQLFSGMDDKFPQFIKPPAKFDQNLPKVPVSHLSELRKTFPEMKDLLIVGVPRVFCRLSIVDPQTASSYSSMAQFQLRREQSFYDRDKTSNMDVMKRNFSSTNWLSDENMELNSPSMITAGGHTFLSMNRGNSSTSLNSIGGMEMQSPPNALGPFAEEHNPAVAPSNFTAASASSDTMKTANEKFPNRSPMSPSAPILIPTSSANAQYQKDQIESLGSNHFSTPEEFGSFGSHPQCGPLRNVFSSNPMFRCSPKITRPLSTMWAHQASQPVLLEEIDNQRYDDKASQTDSININTNTLELQLETVRNELKELSSDIREDGRKFQDFVQNAPLNMSIQLRAQIESFIGARITAAVEANRRQLEEESAKSAEEAQQKFNLQIDALNAKLEAEKQLRESKEHELAKQQEEMSRMHEQLEAMMGKNLELEKVAQQREEALAELQARKFESTSILLNEVAPQDFASMTVSQSVIEMPPEECQVQQQNSVPGSDEEEGVARLSSRSCSTQTKIRCKDMQNFVLITEIQSGFGALIVWNASYNAFMAFCSNPKYPYIVKDGCLERLGIKKPPRLHQSEDPSTTTASTSTAAVPPTAPQRTSAFVIVESLEPCQIRKPTNRYNLPIDTRFYRIVVRPMPGDFGSSLSSVSSIASSSRR